MNRSPFDPIVDAYDAARPDYPAAAYDELQRLAGPLAGATVAEAGAGTGIATRALVEQGAYVLAVDIGEQMLRRLRERSPSAPAALADGHALPLPAGSVDMVLYAQAWHWMRVPDAAAEAVRVLRPGGALALLFNDVAAAGEPWWQAQQDRLEAANPAYRRDYRCRDWAAELGGLPGLAPAAVAEVSWVRPLPVQDYLTWLRSKSYVAALGDRLEDFLAAERASLLGVFPAGVVREPFRTHVVVARRR